MVAAMKRLVLAAALLFCAPAVAQVPMVGAFVAEATCAATPSIRDVENNPGDVSTQAGRSYDLVGRNAVPGSHYLILVPGAEPERRWVAYGCGRVQDEAGVGQAQGPETPQSPRAPAQRRDDYVLAASWQPAFCETRPRVSECRSGARDDAGFSLHGLWPQPRGREYCGVEPRLVEIDEDGDWLRLPAPELAATTERALQAVMPGVASGLDRHEWIKHGTCFAGDAQGYFDLSIRLMEELNDSAVRDLFEASIGETLTATQIRDRFDEAFGRGAGSRVLVDCVEVDGRRLVRELRIELSGTPLEPLEDLIGQAASVSPGCASGEVDAAGLRRSG